MLNKRSIPIFGHIFESDGTHTGTEVPIQLLHLDWNDNLEHIILIQKRVIWINMNRSDWHVQSKMRIVVAILLT